MTPTRPSRTATCRAATCRSARRRQQFAAVADYARLETASWKGAAGSAVGAGDAQGRFYRQALAVVKSRYAPATVETG